jgi:hypothetical protein
LGGKICNLTYQQQTHTHFFLKNATLACISSMAGTSTPGMPHDSSASTDAGDCKACAMV